MEIKRKLDSIGISRINISIFLLEGVKKSLFNSVNLLSNISSESQMRSKWKAILYTIFNICCDVIWMSVGREQSMGLVCRLPVEVCVDDSIVNRDLEIEEVAGVVIFVVVRFIKFDCHVK